MRGAGWINCILRLYGWSSVAWDDRMVGVKLALEVTSSLEQTHKTGTKIPAVGRHGFVL